ncbi:MAG: hypothetical protein H8E68_06765 [Kiritimatiellaeota bacterium]|nr:hypothetical protein [Kiritimatiellota bacterium]
MAKNRFTKIKGTKDFLVLAVACIFICLWSISDAWFPRKSVREKHPQSYPVTMAVSGVVQTIPVKAGDEVAGAAPLLTLVATSYKAAVETAEEAYKAAKGSDTEILKEKLDALVQARDNLRATTVTCNDFTLETTHGEVPLHGVVLDILVEPATQVAAGETVMLVRPNDSFYIFNKTLAGLTFFVAIFALIFHRIASR